jgi:RNA polymerase sigma-70 factor (ECF subfamily)
MRSPSEASATSSTLLARVRTGEPAAWDRLVALYAPLVWHWCRASGLQDQDGADVLQDVFHAVAARLDDFRRRPTGTFRGWLRIITRHKICDLFRRQRREPPGAGGSDAQRWLGQVEAPEEPLGRHEEDSQTDGTDRRVLVRQLLELLRPEFSEQTWQAFWRTAVEGEQAVETARLLHMSPGAVRVAKCRVLRRLRAELAAALEG